MIKKYFYLIPLLALIVEALYAVYVVSTTDVIFGNKHYWGFFFIMICIVLMFLKKSLGIYFTGITLLVGCVNAIAFTPSIEAYSFGFGINDASATSIKIQLFSFLILILYLVLNGRFLFNKLNKGKINDKDT